MAKKQLCCRHQLRKHLMWLFTANSGPVWSPAGLACERLNDGLHLDILPRFGYFCYRRRKLCEHRILHSTDSCDIQFASGRNKTTTTFFATFLQSHDGTDGSQPHYSPGTAVSSHGNVPHGILRVEVLVREVDLNLSRFLRLCSATPRRLEVSQVYSYRNSYEEFHREL